MGVEPVWHAFDVDGVTYFWTAYPSTVQRGGGPEEPTEYLNVARQPITPGIGWPLPAGTVVTEEHARKLVRLASEQGVAIP